MDYRANHIKIHDKNSFDCMRKAGSLAAACLDYIIDFIEPGVTTEKLDQLCHEYQIKNASPLFCAMIYVFCQAIGSAKCIVKSVDSAKVCRTCPHEISTGHIR